jgi:hypothetical protein
MRRELLFLLIVAVGSLLSSQQPFSRAITYEEGTSLKGGQTDWCAYPSIVMTCNACVYTGVSGVYRQCTGVNALYDCAPVENDTCMGCVLGDNDLCDGMAYYYSNSACTGMSMYSLPSCTQDANTSMTTIPGGGSCPDDCPP